MWSAEIRESFLKYFEARGHRRVRSSALIPIGDPTLLFTNAGMVQFKDVFLGTEKHDYNRAATAQKCVRAGGKHNDLENVGHTSRHHTFFEMLGNFSFGDYFKEDAIVFAWDFLTEVARLPVERLWATIYRDDDEAGAIWERKIRLPSARIVRLGDKDNFWAMGDTGPCGPCSEIVYDQGEGFGCGKPDCAVGCDCDRFLEIWNLVFMQFNRDASGILTPLPKPSIDTGMGLERLAAVVQGKRSNYDTDLFAPLLQFIQSAAGGTYGHNESSDVSMRVIADHLRATAFLISDGVLPSNEGRGYVLRRIMRRAGRHAYLLGIHEEILHRGVAVVAEVMGRAYPELGEHALYAAGIVKQEEERFLATLETGLGILNEVVLGLRRQDATVIPGDAVFKLYDTYGFPLDLVEEAARDEKLTIDMELFHKLMAEQKDRARASWVGSGAESLKGIWRQAAATLPPAVFTGYECETATAQVTAIMKAENVVEEAGEGDEVEVALDRTPFYGESGGQVGDLGIISAPGLTLVVSDTKKPADKLIIHHGRITEGKLSAGMQVTAAVDGIRRGMIAANHTATHLLQAALRRILGDHVKQAGSLVTPERLRFDFNHAGPVKWDELRAVEEAVNQIIRRNVEVRKRIQSLDEAVKGGATAIFGEKYGEQVRVVTVVDFSAELCGGVHVARTGDIGLFKIIGESSVAAGVRRIEAVTGAAAISHINESERILHDLTDLAKVPISGLLEKWCRLQDDLKHAQRQREMARGAAGGSTFNDLAGMAVTKGGITVVIAGVHDLDIKTMRDLVDRCKAAYKDMIAILIGAVDGKLAIVAGVAGEALKIAKAGELVSKIALVCGGRGGGRPDFAQAGAPDGTAIAAALEEARRLAAAATNA